MLCVCMWEDFGLFLGFWVFSCMFSLFYSGLFVLLANLFYKERKNEGITLDVCGGREDLG